MAYLKFLIYTAVFKHPLADKRGAEYVQYYLRWTRTFAAHEDVYRKQLLEALEIWYDMFPPTKKRGRSLLGAGPPSLAAVALLDNPEFDVPIRGPHGLMARGAGARGAGAELPAGGAGGAGGGGGGGQ